MKLRLCHSYRHIRRHTAKFYEDERVRPTCACVFSIGVSYSMEPGTQQVGPVEVRTVPYILWEALSVAVVRWEPGDAHRDKKPSNSCSPRAEYVWNCAIISSIPSCEFSYPSQELLQISLGVEGRIGHVQDAPFLGTERC